MKTERPHPPPPRLWKFFIKFRFFLNDGFPYNSMEEVFLWNFQNVLCSPMQRDPLVALREINPTRNFYCYCWPMKTQNSYKWHECKCRFFSLEGIFLSMLHPQSYLHFLCFHLQNVHRRQEMWPWQLFSSSSVGTNFCLSTFFSLSLSFCHQSVFSLSFPFFYFSWDETAWNVFIEYFFASEEQLLFPLSRLFSLSLSFCHQSVFSLSFPLFLIFFEWNSLECLHEIFVASQYQLLFSHSLTLFISLPCWNISVIFL